MSGVRLTLHHVGCLVEDITASLGAYATTTAFANVAPPVTVTSQKAKVCFLPTGNGTFIEFVQPEPDNAFLLKLLRKGTHYYHVGFTCEDMERAVQDFLSTGAHQLDSFHSEAFAGRKCVFLITAEQQFIELIESA